MSDIIDINVTQTVEEVTINVVDNVIQVNINQVNGGGGGAVDSVNGQTGVVVLDQDDIADGTTYKQYSLTEKNKLAGIQAGAEVNVNADWNATSGDSQILNKPTIPNTSNLVPYTGATTNVDLGVNTITTSALIINTSGSNKKITLSSNNIQTERVAEWQDKDYVGIADISDIPDVSTLVPYTGANANVNLGEFELKSGQVTLDTTPTGTATVGTTRWNDTIGSSETTLKGGSVILKNGVDLVARVVNKVTPNTTLTKTAYQVVKVSGAQGQRLAVELAQANNDNNSADTLGIVTETIATNQEGFILTVGQLEGIDTTGSLQGETWTDGDVLYLSPTTAGRITNIKPNGSTGHIVILGYVEYAHSVNGKIYVKIMNGWELDELHNVFIDTPLNNQLLSYETATSLWKNKSIGTILGYTPYKFIQTSQTAHTGTTAETVIATATISGSTFNTSDVMKTLFGINKTGTGGTYSLRLKVNTSNTLTGATQIALFTSASGSAQMAIMSRSFSLNGGNLYGYSFTGNAITDIASIGGALSSTAYNTANTLYFFFTVQLANAGDSITSNLTNITN